MVSNLLLGGLGFLAVIFAVYFVRDILAHRGELEKGTNGLLSALIGFGINFLDTLGIGSFALGLALYKSLHQVDDRKIPGTLNVSCVPPVIAEACFFISAVQVEPLTLATMLLSATLGAWIGAGAVSKLSKQKVQLFMGIALVVIGVVIVCQTVGLVPGRRGDRSSWSEAHHCGRDQFLPRRDHDARRGTLCPLLCSGLAAGDGSEGRFSDHDGILRLSHAGGVHPLYQGRDV